VQDETKPDLLVTIDSDAFIKRDKEVEESDFSSKKNLKAPLKC
jgi:hypothetical protein